MWWHSETSSSCLFNKLAELALAITNFSHKCKAHFLVPQMYECAFIMCFSVGNNLNCSTTHKHDKAMFFMSPQKVTHTHVSKSEWTVKQEVEASFKVLAWKQISFANI